MKPGANRHALDSEKGASLLRRVPEPLDQDEGFTLLVREGGYFAKNVQAVFRDRQVVILLAIDEPSGSNRQTAETLSVQVHRSSVEIASRRFHQRDFGPAFQHARECLLSQVFGVGDVACQQEAGTHQASALGRDELAEILARRRPNLCLGELGHHRINEPRWGL